MMTNLNKETLISLFEHDAPQSISIYLPMARAGKETRKNSIRYKNATKQVETLLEKAGHDQRMIKDTLEKLSDIIGGYEFFQEQLDGLAVFLAGDFYKIIKLPVRFEQQVEIGGTFELRPLLEALQNDTEFYILALSKKQSRLFRAGKFNIAEIELGSDTPTNFDEAMRYDDPEDQLQHQTISSADGGNTPIFHGHTESDKMKKDLRRFFRMLDNGVEKAITDHNLPVLLVGLEYLHPVYRDASRLPNIIEQGIEIRHDHMTIDDLHQLAWETVKKEVESPASKAIEQYKSHLGNDKSSADLSQLPLAAAFGRLDTLLVEKDSKRWGTVNTDKKETIVRDEPSEHEDTELLSYTVKQTLINGGQVYVFDEEQLPSAESPAAGILRY